EPLALVLHHDFFGEEHGPRAVLDLRHHLLEIVAAEGLDLGAFEHRARERTVARGGRENQDATLELPAIDMGHERSPRAPSSRTGTPVRMPRKFRRGGPT